MTERDRLAGTDPALIPPWLRPLAAGDVARGRAPAPEDDHEPATELRFRTREDVIRGTETILQSALSRRARFLYFELTGSGGRVRLRTADGLHETWQASSGVLSLMIAWLVRLARLPPRTTESVGEGTIDFPIGRGVVTLGAFFVNTAAGPAAALSFPDDLRPRIPLGAIHLPPEVEQMVDDALGQPQQHPASNGIVLLAGLRGSGRTTTLEALVETVAIQKRAVLFLQEEVGRIIDDVTQIQVGGTSGLALETLMDHLCHHATDAIFLDPFSPVPAQASGALRILCARAVVVGTLLAADALEALPAWVGAAPDRLASTLDVRLVLGQRLVRTVCSACCQAVPPDEPAGARLLATKPAGETWDGLVARPVGCDACRFTGYDGRMALFEAVRVSAGLKEALMRDEPRENLERIALDEGATLLPARALEAVRGRRTTLSEIEC